MRKSSGVIVRMSVFIFCLVLLIPAAQSQTRRKSTLQRSTATRGAAHIPRGTQMKIRLGNEINTKESRDRDAFTAVVLTPSRYADSKIEGHIAKINKSGKLTGKTELALAFD